MQIRTLAAIAAAAGLSACAAEFNAVAIQAICAPPVPDTDGSCTYPATCSDTLAGTPVLDVTTAQLDFRLPVEIRNALQDNSSQIDGRINTNDAFIQSFEMKYAGTSLAAWSVPAAVTVPTQGTASAVLRLIPVQYFGSISPPPAATTTITVSVRAAGVFSSQSGFTTAWFDVPVAVCAGCLAASPCATGTVFTASCPPAAPGATAPGQTAVPLCTAVAQ
ncbi:MAG TPA: hypothetical protein VFM53_03350 [Anaeromyxobacteraceae bacterium]|nr:hypothetical protein [Anaeromyxobacteraceae bacterium]